MTEYKKAVTAIDELEAAAAKLAEDCSDENLAKADRVIDDYLNFKHKLEAQFPQFTKFRQKAAEKDPDKQTYGPKMLQNVQSLIERYDELYEIHEERMKPLLSHMAAEKQAMNEREKARLERALAENEEERRKQQRAETEKEEREREEALKRKKEAEEAARLLQEEAKKKQEDAAAAEDAARDAALLSAMERDTKSAEGARGAAVESLVRLAQGTKGEMRDALDALMELLSAIMGGPEEAHIRVLRLGSEKFRDRIGKFPGSVLLLRSIGFSLSSLEGVRDILTKVHGAAKVAELSEKELFLVLQEPSVARYDEWKAWLSKIEKLRAFLTSVREDIGTMTHAEAQQAAAQHAEREVLEAMWMMAGLPESGPF
uniref:Uncharacterized protein n=1 Tax=Chromera velia CCMP2878 TaxID=1169474 RepID=A0A0G4HL43_9ALVE|eukprot:Cvel_7376.t1-p1 / transcript=Cvel_7376.t1 / gene=Cvel_7376 / organism=Chromera_velia_CCMP2878 / gene_product=hypothetical protein / transcript_product=hypothetical protein / location=Cvel_scaffold384:2295-8358(+) / protein_length=371 / sequence_SO=supercontig / SO=protein_coding / is_pseudo=false